MTAAPATAPDRVPLKPRPDVFVPNIAQSGDALALLQSLPADRSPLAFFDPEYRGVLDHLKFANEGARQRGRAALPPMSEYDIDAVSRGIARVLKPSGYLMRWTDTFGLCEGHHLRIADAINPVGLIAWDAQRLGMGKTGALARRLSPGSAKAPDQRPYLA